MLRQLINTAKQDTVHIDSIRLDGGTQPRQGIDAAYVTELAESMVEGAKLPPIDVMYDGQNYWLFDGFHRVAAHKEAGFLIVDANIHQGTQADAQWCSYAANQTHGLRRSNDDKQRAIKAALRHPNAVSMPDREIARHLGVDHKTVGSWREKLQSSGEIPQIDDRTVSRNGQTYTQNTANIGATRPSQPAGLTPEQEAEFLRRYWPIQRLIDDSDPEATMRWHMKAVHGYAGDLWRYDTWQGRVRVWHKSNGDYWDREPDATYTLDRMFKLGLEMLQNAKAAVNTAQRPSQITDRQYASLEDLLDIVRTTVTASDSPSPREMRLAADERAPGHRNNFYYAVLNKVRDKHRHYFRLDDMLQAISIVADEYGDAKDERPLARTVYVSGLPDLDLPTPSIQTDGDRPLPEWVTEDATPDPAPPAAAVPVSMRDDYDSDEWYTPSEYIEAARSAMGTIDLDPATCEMAQTVVQADVYLTKADNGLGGTWIRENIWLNPPYSNSQAWIDKLMRELDGTFVKQAVVLVNNATETAWFQTLLKRSAVVCFPARRLQFWRHDHSNVGTRQGQAIFYIGDNAAAFVAEFESFGIIMRRA